MELRQVVYVLAVVDEGGFTRAADALDVAQPSLSHGVRTLEAELGTPLFHRLGRHVELTAAGEAFVGPARQLVRASWTAQTAVAEVAGLMAGHLDLVALPTLAVDPLAALIGAFRVAHPGVVVRVANPEDAAGVAASVLGGHSEVGFAELPVAGDVVSVEVLTQEILAVCPPGTVLRGRRLPVRRLARMPLVTTPPATSTRRLVDQVLAAVGVTPTIAVETAQREALLPLVLAGAGVTFLPATVAHEAAGQGAVVASLDPALRRRIGIVHRPGPLSPAARAFVELAVGRLRRH